MALVRLDQETLAILLHLPEGTEIKHAERCVDGTVEFRIEHPYLPPTEGDEVMRWKLAWDHFNSKRGFLVYEGLDDSYEIYSGDWVTKTSEELCS